MSAARALSFSGSRGGYPQSTMGVVAAIRQTLADAAWYAGAHAAYDEGINAVMDAARHTAVLWFGEIMQRELYFELGHSSIQQYAAQGLGFSRSKTYQFIRLAGDLLPAFVQVDQLAPDRQVLEQETVQAIRVVESPGLSHPGTLSAAC